MELQDSRCPYVAGNRVIVKLTDSSHTGQQRLLEGTIQKVFEPFTLSCVMLVAPDPQPHFTEPFILKLFDRRFATQLRKDEKVEPWTMEIEQAYRQSIADGSAEAFIQRLRSDDKLPEKEGNSWDTAQNEAYLQDFMQDFYKAETEVYRRLKDIQGKNVPRLLGCVTMPGCSSETMADNDYTTCPGILLQYIQGFPLTDVANHAPKEMWQSICEEAIRILNLIGDRDIRNEDVKTRSFIVQKDQTSTQYQVYMIDFALCEFRGVDQDEQDWRMLKAYQDEEGAIGRIMQKRLTEAGFLYNRSPKYLKLDYDFMREEISA